MLRHEPNQNRLLAALSPLERERLVPHLKLVPMPLGKVLYESGDVLRHVYFPIDCIVSLLYVLETVLRPRSRRWATRVGATS